MLTIGKGGQRDAKSGWNEREVCVSGGYSSEKEVKRRCASLSALLSCGIDVNCEGRRGNRMLWERDCKK